MDALRKLCKTDARRMLAGSWPAAAALTLLVLAASSGLSAMEAGVHRLAGLEITRDYLRTPQFYLDDLLNVSLQAVAVTGGFALLSLLLLGPLLLGERYWYLRTAAGDQAPGGAVFYGFCRPKRYFKWLWFTVAVGARVFLVGAVLFLPSLTVLVGGVLAASLPKTFPMQGLYAFVWVVCGAGLVLASGVFTCLFAARYFVARYAVTEDGVSVRQAIRRSVQCMKGRKTQLLGFLLSFFWWYLLCLLVAPVLFVRPYLLASLTLYARYLMEAQAHREEAHTTRFSPPPEPEERPEEPLEEELPPEQRPPRWNFREEDAQPPTA